MDYTTIAPWKAEEKELSEKLYKKLQGLMLLYPATDDFRKCFTEEMFLKPNQHAFFQVMHYLFKLHDPIEFRKRFYWPVTDKKGEANFRASTVEYLKHLNEKHQLHWNNVKSYLVVMPGGMKFINFLLDFVSFVVQEQIKQREKYLSMSSAEFSVDDANIKRMQVQNKFLKEYASAFIKEASNHIVKVQDKTKLIKSTLTQLATSKAFSCNDAHVLDNKFLKAFEADNYILFEQNFNTPMDNVSSVQQLLAGLKVAMDKFQSKESELKINKDAVRQSLLKIKEMFPTRLTVDGEELEFQATPYNASIRINSLISAFNCIYPIIEEQLIAAEQMPRCSNFVIEELARLKSELQHIEFQITDFQKKINMQMKKISIENNQDLHTPLRPINRNLIPANNENTLLSKIVATPPIKLEMQDSNIKRLPFLDDCTLNTECSMIANARAGMENFNNLLAHPRSNRKQKSPEISMEFNNTLQKSKIIDPMELLRTIQKDTTKVKSLPQQCLSTLGSNWKERQAIFGNDIALPTPTIPINANSPFKNPAFSNNLSNCEKEQSNGATHYNETLTPLTPITPFNSNENEHTRIACPQLLETSANSSKAAVNSLIFPKKLSAVKKVLDASLNFQNLSTSPSGRLDPLVIMEPNVLLSPKLLMNDVCATAGAEKVDLLEQDNKENDLWMDLYESPLQSEIFNISDGVLRDVTM